MKVLLINPPWRLGLEEQDHFRISQPDGLAYVASSLEKGGNEVLLIDGAACGWERQQITGDSIHLGMGYGEIFKEIDRFQPEIIGVSIVSTIFKDNAFNLTKELKKNYPSIKIMVGGMHASVAPGECLSDNGIDYVVIGEGELTSVSLIGELGKRNPVLSSVLGIAYLKDGVMTRTEPRKRLDDLDLLPFPARHFYPMDDYYKASRRLMSTFALSTYNQRWATMISSRGCPYKCVFCSICLTMGRKWRARSAENVVDEIGMLVDKYGVEHIAFLDDNMTLDKGRMHRICNLIMKRNIKFEWSTPNGLRADSLDEEILVKMKRTGCQRIAVAPESGSQRVVNEVIGKRLRLSEVEKVVKICKRIGLKIDCFFVLGVIGDTKEEMEETIGFARHLKKLGASGFNMAIATPFPGTELHSRLVKEGLLSVDFDKFTMFRNDCYIGTKDFTAEELKDLKRRADKVGSFPWDYLKFVFLLLIRDPARFFRLLKSRG